MTGRQESGVSLIEIVIVILAVAVQGVLLGVAEFTKAGAPTAAQLNLATELAQERMEMVLADRRMKGFGSFADPCAGGTPPANCSPPNAALYSLLPTTLSGAWSVEPDTAQYRVITVTVNGPEGQAAQLVTLVANY